MIYYGRSSFLLVFVSVLIVARRPLISLGLEPFKKLESTGDHLNDSTCCPHTWNLSPVSRRRLIIITIFPAVLVGTLRKSINFHYTGPYQPALPLAPISLNPHFRPSKFSWKSARTFCLFVLWFVETIEL